MTLSDKIIPLVELKNGRIWNSNNSSYYIRDGEYLDPFEIMDELSEQYERLYLIDIDGIENNNPQLDLLNELTDYAKLWIDTGPRRWEDLFDVVVVGSEKSIISLDFIPFEDLKKILDYTEQIGVKYPVNYFPSQADMNALNKYNIIQIIHFDDKGYFNKINYFDENFAFIDDIDYTGSNSSYISVINSFRYVIKRI
ncbi:MAG: HisA/HisF-related TIM barrel protein [Candidatus Thermoplasmatota archaeon]|jgi:hypothetical protein|nr:HisA/HisF-related TIM barrel protein [Candidatus Thermoplasmatota archaeon]MCL5963247.1 HisA/HisF-related TIM barrel protein [Candidatus Thermoplasmatota archaeon]